MKDNRNSGPSKWALIGIFSLIALMLLVGGYWYYGHEAEAIRNHEYGDLKAIADLKVAQIVRWRDERIADARLNSRAPFLRASVAQWLKAPGRVDLKKALTSRLNLIKDLVRYQNVILAGLNGRILLTLDPGLTGLEPETRKLVAETVSAHGVVFGDFFRCPICQQVHLDVAAPILDQAGKILAVLILRTDPEIYLYPLIQSWPTASKSAEILLIRKDGNEILFLNVLRHRAGPALTLRFPGSFSDLPAVQAGMGKTGLFEGLDYRQVKVLADLRPVPGSPWFMVAKVDRDEILAEAAQRARLIGILTLALIVLFGIGTAFLYKHQGKRALQALYQAERRRAELLEQARVTLYSIGDAVITTGSDGLVKQMNPVAEKLAGWQETEASGRPISQVFRIVNEETRAEVENPIERVLREGLIVGLANHTLLIAKDGVERPIADSGAPIRNEAGEIIGVVLVFRDQTEERKNLAALQETLKEKAFLADLIEQSSQPLAVGYPDGRLGMANPAFCNLVGYSLEELKAIDWATDLTPPEWLDGEQARLKELHQTGRPVRYEKEYIRKDGTRVPIELLVHLARDEKGQPEYYYAFVTDISERKRAEEERTKMMAQLQQAQKMETVGRLAGGVAHDFNNLLTTIIGNAQMALMDVDREGPLAEVLGEIKAAGERAAGLTRQLLAFSRKQVLQPEIVDLNEVVQEVEKILKRLIGEDIELETVFDTDLGQVEADVGQMEQVIINLAVNARDALPRGGKLTIETANTELDEHYAASRVSVTPGPYVVLSVSDNGIGMTREVQSHIFEPFFTSKEKGKGTGLGLAMVYGIVKQSGGNIWVYSEVGKGTTFKIYLPRVDKTAGAEKNKTLLTEVRGGLETVLVVEDEESVRNLVVTVLKRFGYTVLTAEDGQKALEIFQGQEGSIDLLLTDVIMPLMNGKELAELLEGLQPDLKVLFMSGYTDNAIVHHGILDKGIAFIQKPFPPEDLARKVREVLGRGSQRRKA
ncbi:MAG: PAS domain S-box protein [Pseudomonadota bacterium]